MKILVAGELNPDLILRNYQMFPTLGKEVLVEDLQLTLGSSSAICAVGIARLGNNVAFAANVGADTYGDFCIGLMKEAGVDVSLINRRKDLKTGITVSMTSAKDRALVTYPGAISTLSAKDLPADVFSGLRHFHVSSYFLQDALRPDLKALFAKARKAGVSTSLDTGYDPAEQWSPDLLDTLKEVDVFLPNEIEIQSITKREDILEGLKSLDNGHTLTVAKLGADGCMTLHDGKLVKQKAFPVKVVDTTGAGDSFDAGFLHAWLRGQPIEQCLRVGAACGGLSTQGLGGIATQPSEKEVESFLNAQAGN
jgi:sugar/nucleoside kinase (ribokinase family)